MVLKKRCVWKIKSLEGCHEKCSPSFVASPDKMSHRWKLEFRPIVDMFLGRNGFQLRLVADEPLKEPILARFEYTIYNKKKEVLDKGSTGSFCEIERKRNQCYRDSEGIAHYNFQFIDKICVEIELVRKSPNHPSDVDAVNSSRSLDPVNQQLTKTLQEDLLKLYESKSFTDLTILCGNREFYVHKHILAIRSSVFKSDFEKEGEDKFSEIILLNEVHPDALEAFLKFMYTAAIKIERHMIDDILRLGKKYHVEELIQLCELELVRDINVSTVVGVFESADKYGMTGVKENAMKFLKENLRDVSKSEEWTTVFMQRADLMAGLLNSLTLKNGE